MKTFGKCQFRCWTSIDLGLRNTGFLHLTTQKENRQELFSSWKFSVEAPKIFDLKKTCLRFRWISTHFSQDAFGFLWADLLQLRFRFFFVYWNTLKVEDETTLTKNVSNGLKPPTSECWWLVFPWNWHDIAPEKWMVGRQSFWILAYFLWWTVSCREVNVMERDEGFPIVHPTGMISTRRHRFISPDIPSIPKQLKSNLLGVIIHDPNSYEMLNTDLTKYMMNSIVFLWGPNFEVAFFCILFFFPLPQAGLFPHVRWLILMNPRRGGEVQLWINMPTQDLDDHTKTRLGCSSMIITEKSFEVQTSDWPRCFLFFFLQRYTVQMSADKSIKCCAQFLGSVTWGNHSWITVVMLHRLFPGNEPMISPWFVDGQGFLVLYSIQSR